jgi:hypothetical protein
MTTLFRKAEITSAYLKMGLMGFTGSGKTHTATLVAIGLAQMARELNLTYANKPAFFLDTETGSDWVKPQFDKAGIEVFTAKTRSFSDLLGAVKEAEANSCMLLIDSITHFWREITETYMRAKKRTRLQFEDWNYLKTEWGKFSDLFVNSNLHVLMCGRAGFEYDYTTDDETGKKNLEKTGIKMKAESEMGYEPSLLVLMEREMDMEKMIVRHTARVLKDRSTLLDGKDFHNPTFASFLPHIQCLNLGGRQMGVDTSRTSEHLITPDKKDWNPVQRRIAVDEIQSFLVLHIPGQAAADKKRKIELIRKHFNNAAWTEIEEVMPLFDLRAGYDSLHQELEGKPSRYSPAVQSIYAPPVKAQTVAQEMDDAIPEHNDKSDPGDIPESLKREPPKPINVEERLLSDIPNLPTAQDCLHWGLEMHDTFETLNKTAKARVREALMARTVALANGSGGAHHR